MNKKHRVLDGRYNPWTSVQTRSKLSQFSPFVSLPTAPECQPSPSNRAITHVPPEEVPLHLDVLPAVGNALVNSKVEGTIVVFEDLTFGR